MDDLPGIMIGIIIVGIFLLILHLSIGDIIEHLGVGGFFVTWLGSGITLGKLIADKID